MPETTRPQDVPDDSRERIAIALYRRLREHVGSDAGSQIRAEARADDLADAVMGEVEQIKRQVRERVAAEIEDPSVWPDHFGCWTAEQAEAARTMKQYVLARIARTEP